MRPKETASTAGYRRAQRMSDRRSRSGTAVNAGKRCVSRAVLSGS